jgi:hypothetical protein
VFVVLFTITTRVEEIKFANKERLITCFIFQKYHSVNSVRCYTKILCKQMSARGKSSARGGGDNKGKATITQDELEKMTERLTRQPKKPVAGDDHLLAPKKTITTEDLQKQITRLYDQSIETKQRKVAKAAAAEKADIPQSKKLTEEELAESVTRQYTQALQTKQNASERLKKKYLFNPAEHSISASQLTPRTKTEIKALGDRLYGESVQKKKEKEQKLYEKYVAATGPQKKFISTEEAKEAADRLSAPKDGFAGVPIPMGVSVRHPGTKKV